MPTYAIKAPNGQTYQIDGPAGASDDQVRAEVMRQHPDAAPATPAPTATPDKPTVLSTLGRMAYNLPGDTWKTMGDMVALPGQISNAVTHPAETATALGGVAHNAADILMGGVQHVRDMSPADLQGSAPHMDTAAYDKFASDNYDKYGTWENTAKTIGDHPLGPVLTAASVAVPALRALGVGKLLPAAADAAASALPGPLKSIANAGRRGAAAAGQMSAEATQGLNDSTGAAQAAAQAASDRAARASALAATSRAQGGALNTRRAAAAAASTPPDLNIGDAAHLSDIGDSVRTPALANEDTLNSNMRAADAKYRAAMQQITDANAANDVGVSDMSSAQAQVAKSKAIVDPDPVTRPSVGNVPADDAGARLHKMALDALGPKEEPLTVAQAKQITEAGGKVNAAPNGTFTRTIKPSFKNADDFRRFLGKVLNGQVEGYGSVNADEARQLYGSVSSALDEYAQGAPKAVQQNWAAGKQALQPYENMRIGKAIVGTQDGTSGIPSVPAANIPGRIIAGGRDTIGQAASVAGPAPVASAVRSQVQNALTGVKGSDAIQAVVGPGTKLGDVIHADPSLESAVSDYLGRTKVAEQSGAQATSLANRASTSMDRAKVLDQAANTLQGTAGKATDIVSRNTRDLAALQAAPPREVGKQYIQLLNRAHAEGSIGDDQLRQGLQLANTAEKAFQDKAARDTWLRLAAGGLGIGALAQHTGHLVTSAFGGN